MMGEASNNVYSPSHREDTQLYCLGSIIYVFHCVIVILSTLDMADRLHQPLQLYINGQDVPAKNNRTFPVSNPMTGAKLFDCASAGTEDYEDAIQHAHIAFKTWSKSTPSQRRLIFLRAADILTTYLDDPSDASAILSHEVSAVPSYVKLNILAAAAVLRDTAGLVTHIKGEMIPADRPETTILVKREPMGVILAMSPWNAPVGERVHLLLIVITKET